MTARNRCLRPEEQHEPPCGGRSCQANALARRLVAQPRANHAEARSDLLQTRPFPDERGSPSTAPLLAISRVSGVGWLVVVVIASLAAPGHHPLPTQAVAFADWTTDHGHFAPRRDTRLQPLDLPASRSPGLQRASDRPTRRGPFPCGLLGVWRRQPHSDAHRPLR